jgi:hypothetical protein
MMRVAPRRNVLQVLQVASDIAMQDEGSGRKGMMERNRTEKAVLTTITQGRLP